MHFLRHTPADAASLPGRIAAKRDELAAALDRGDARQVIDDAGELVAMLTAARREGEAFAIGIEHLALARANPAIEESTWLLHQLATAAQYHGARAQANDLFAEALSLCHQHRWRRLEHFVLHHWGRSRAEEGDLEEAERCFIASRAIRAGIDERLVASSDKAIAELAKLRAENECQGFREGR